MHRSLQRSRSRDSEILSAMGFNVGKNRSLSRLSVTDNRWTALNEIIMPDVSSITTMERLVAKFEVSPNSGLRALLARKYDIWPGRILVPSLNLPELSNPCPAIYNSPFVPVTRLRSYIFNRPVRARRRKLPFPILSTRHFPPVTTKPTSLPSIGGALAHLQFKPKFKPRWGFLRCTSVSRASTSSRQTRLVWAGTSPCSTTVIASTAKVQGAGLRFTWQGIAIWSELPSPEL